MYGFVYAATGDILIFDTREQARVHAAQVLGLTRVTIREVTNATPAAPRRTSSSLGPTMDAFLAGGQ